MEAPARPIVVIRGSGDIGSAVAHRLFRAGYPVVIHDGPAPTAARRKMAFTDAVFDGSATLAGLSAHRVDQLADLAVALNEAIAIFVGDFGDLLAAVEPRVLVDARMRKRATPEPQVALAPLTIGLGPNFVAGTTTHLVIETEWGDRLGTVLTEGTPAPLGGEPRSYGGHTRDRFVYAPADGVFHTACQIGEQVEAGQQVATLGSQQLTAPLTGILRGLTRDGVTISAGTKCVEIDPRGDPALVAGIGERPGKIADGVLAAIQGAARG